MLEFEADDGPEVDAIEGYLLAVPRALAARVGVDPKDRYYRNADLDYCFAVRALGYRATRVDVPAARHRHRGFHDTDPGNGTVRPERTTIVSSGAGRSAPISSSGSSGAITGTGNRRAGFGV